MLTDSLKTILFATLRPARFFENERPVDQLLTWTVYGLGALLIGGTVILFATALIHMQEIMRAQEAITAYYTQTGRIPLYEDPSPWKFLGFPVLWVILFAITAGLRHGAMAVFGDESRNFLTMLAITGLAYTPLVLIAIFHGLVNNLFPFASAVEDSLEIFYRSVAIMLVTLMGMILEARIAVRAFQEVFGQNKGRAVLTWFTPWLCMIVLYAFFRFFGGN